MTKDRQTSLTNRLTNASAINL